MLASFKVPAALSGAFYNSRSRVSNTITLYAGGAGKNRTSWKYCDYPEHFERLLRLQCEACDPKAPAFISFPQLPRRLALARATPHGPQPPRAAQRLRNHRAPAGARGHRVTAP